MSIPNSVIINREAHHVINERFTFRMKVWSTKHLKQRNLNISLLSLETLFWIISTSSDNIKYLSRQDLDLLININHERSHVSQRVIVSQHLLFCKKMAWVRTLIVQASLIESSKNCTHQCSANAVIFIGKIPNLRTFRGGKRQAQKLILIAKKKVKYQSNDH